MGAFGGVFYETPSTKMPMLQKSGLPPIPAITITNDSASGHLAAKPARVFSHKQWLAKPRTWKLWGGAAEVERVRTWRKLHPFYWKRTIPLISPKLNCAT
jgi:predicted transcriptional regulator